MTDIPVPEPDLASANFFAALDAGRLEILRCDDCGTANLAVLRCDVCAGIAFTPESASGRATLYSFTRVHIAHHPAFADRLPVCGGIVELEEGPRLFAPLSGEGALCIGAELVVELIPSGGRMIAGFRLAAQETRR